jgi:hypothetical protein
MFALTGTSAAGTWGLAAGPLILRPSPELEAVTMLISEASVMRDPSGQLDAGAEPEPEAGVPVPESDFCRRENIPPVAFVV